ncbi:uncharacterized protein LOC105184559 [Harpegnathos saltator]|uniref:uncharacterized protein LOC105184559 n=1 Tax=Harpegnathos saltator TaxID=610380 RepID=UPI000948C0DA|nr:uncharacterized protein LOC105184559 [Harpegnathos saltator]
MPQNMNMEKLELYNRMPTSVYRNSSYLCSNCDYENERLCDIEARKKKMQYYKRHCPSCYCLPEKQRLSSSVKSRTLENVEAMLNGHTFTEPINLTIKKSQSIPLSRKAYRHGYQISTRPYCPKRLPQTHRQRRKKPKFANEDVEVYSKYTQSGPIKSSLQKHNCCKEPERSPGEQRFFNTNNQVSMNYIQQIHELKKSYALNLESRRHCIDRDNEYVTEMKTENDVEHQLNAHRSQNIRKSDVIFEHLEKQNWHKEPIISESDERNEGQKFDIRKVTKPKMLGCDPYCATSSKPFMLAKKSINKSMEIGPDEPAYAAKLDLYNTKYHILESIDHMLGTMDDTKNFVSQEERTDQEIIEKTTREFQEIECQSLLNALTIDGNSTNFDKRIIRLECLDRIRQELIKLYALESTLDNCSPKQQSLSGHNISCNKEQQESHQPLKQKIINS